jgi:hypothetical protein
MLVQCKKTHDGVTMGRFYELKWYANNNKSIVIVNNRFQMIAYPIEYFNIGGKKERLLKMLKSKTFLDI